MEKIFGGLIAILAFLAILVPLTLLRGFAAAQCWAWFVVPTFGLPALGLVQALGLGLTVAVFTPMPSTSSDKDEDWYKPLLMQAIYPLIILLFGAIYHAFM